MLRPHPGRFAISIILAALVISSAQGDDGAARDEFERVVRPLLSARCARCHSGVKQSGGLRIDTRDRLIAGGESGAAIVPGKPEESLLLERAASGEMPPGDAPDLNPREIDALRRWIASGAPMAEAPAGATATDPADHWAYRRVDRNAALGILSPEERRAIEPSPALEGVEPTAPNAPELAAKLECWYRASDLRQPHGSPVVRWPDASGRGRDLVPTRGAAPLGEGEPPTYFERGPIAGGPTVRFDEPNGLGSRGSEPPPIRGDAELTLMIVARLHPRVGGYPHDFILGIGEFASPTDPGRALSASLCIQRTAAGPHRLAFVGGWGHDARWPSGSAAPLYGRPILITLTKRSGPLSSATRLFLNGRDATEFAGYGIPAGDETLPDFQPRRTGDFGVMLGRVVPGAGGFRGEVAEVLVYSRALSDAERRGVEAGLAARYRLEEPRGPGFEPAAALPSKTRDLAARNAIDFFIDRKLHEEGLTKADRAARETLIRRASFDLLGLPPTPERVAAFAADDSPFAWEALIAELLESPQYGERWGRHWLDVARYADTGGYETDITYRYAWRYRDYVVKSLNDDKPFDRFIQEQIAGDEIWPDDLALEGSYALSDAKRRALEAHLGTGFYTLGPRIHESGMDARKLANERLTDWVDATGAAFLGMTVACARCHDHKFDPISQTDYHALQAIFRRSIEIERPIVNAMEIADFQQHYPKIQAVRAARDAYRAFEASIAGRAATPAEEGRRGVLLQAIGRAVLDVPERATSTPNTPFDGLMEIPAAAVLGHERPELVKPVMLLHRGELDLPRRIVEPALPARLCEATETSARIDDGLTNRKQLALWITRPDHPLTARVIVNRVWHWHFGRGIVATPNDFGKMGAPPSHPELLDFLASEFVASGWSIKRLHRLIMTSDAYQRASTFRNDPSPEADPENRLLRRFPRRRLEGEAVWDAIHFAAGTLDLRVGGPPVMPALADDELTALRDRSIWIVSNGPPRRGIYAINRRNFRFPLFDIFDAPGNASSVGARDVSTVAPQSLWLLNNPTARRAATHLAARTAEGIGDRPRQLIDRLWRRTLGRGPSEQEIAEAERLLQDLARAAPEVPRESIAESTGATELPSIDLPPAKAAALIELAIAMFNHNEFLFID
ncbi:MAG: DUF1553 domain-containing protein [Isosphaeraceae bacterium]|nr:DUF1553 domain-containing protein [Isosphaeraceae bacterium]